MTLLDFLRERRQDIAQRWTDRIFQTYPLETVGFLRRSSDPFSNPVAIKTRQAIELLTGALLEAQLDTEEVQPGLDDIMRVRSVQDFTPSQAIGVIYFSKTIIREILEKEKKLEAFSPELLRFESKIDSLALMSMDIYDQCKKQIFELRVKEIKNGYSQVMRLAKLTCDLPVKEPDGDTPF